MKNVKEKLSMLIRIVVSFGLLGFLFWKVRGDIGNVVSIVMKCDVRYIILGVIFLVINVSLLSNRLKIIFGGESIKIRFKNTLQLTLLGYFFNNFMPTAVGGDVVKAYYAGRMAQKKIQAYASVLMDRFIGLYTYLVVAAVALMVDDGKFGFKMVRPVVYVLVFVGFLGLIVVTNRVVAKKLERFFAGIKLFSLGEHLNEAYKIAHDYRNRKGVVLRAFIVSLVSQGVYFSIVYMFFKALGTEVSLGSIFLIMPVVTFISMIPSLGGLGVREMAIVTFFTPMAGKEVSFAVSILVLFGLLFVSLFGGLVYLFWSVKGVPVKKRTDLTTENIEEVKKQREKSGA